jgi:hypothetical protein
VAGGVDPVRAAREIFQDQAFWWKRLEPRPVSSSWLEPILLAAVELIRRAVAWIAVILARILRSLLGAFSGASSGDATVVWLLIAALLAWAVWKLYPVIVRWLSGSKPAAPGQGPVAWETLAEASELYEQAAEAFRKEMYAEAIRLALLALIARLEKQGLLRYDTTRTNREYQRELRQRSDLAGCFGQLARIYERVWYGRLRAGRTDAELALELCGSVINGEEQAPG